MVSSRVATALAGLVVSLLVSLVLWRVFGTVLFFLVVPFVPLLLRGRDSDASAAPRVRSCPDCGFQTRDPEFEYCPLDGARLDRDVD